MTPDYLAFIRAQSAAEYLLTAHARGGTEAGAWRGFAIEQVRDLAKRLGFELVPVVATEEKDAA